MAMYTSSQLINHRKSTAKCALAVACALPLFLCIISLPAAEIVFTGLANSTLDARLKGQILIEELNCVACHTSGAALTTSSKQAPRLADIGSRVNPHYLNTYIRDPHTAKPGTTMPDVLAHVSAEEKTKTALAITHFLLSQKKNKFDIVPIDKVAAKHGERLFHDRGCAACHASRDATGVEQATPNATPLGALDKKYSVSSLSAFLQQPHASRPSGRMPDLGLSRQENERIAHYLLQNTPVPGHLAYTLYRGLVWEGLNSDEVYAERAGHANDFALASAGIVQHNSALTYDGYLHITTPGRYTFYFELNGGSLFIDDKAVMEQEQSNRRGVQKINADVELAVGWRKIRLTYYHTGRNPAFTCEIAGPQLDRQAIPSSMLSVSKNDIPAFEPITPDAELVARGSTYFSKFGCANCHSDVKAATIAAPTFATLTSKKGCLSGTTGPWPTYALTESQTALITAALPQAEAPTLTDKQQLDKTLIVFNCIACHERAGLGGITPHNNALFTGTHGALGDQGRLPPPLTHVGAKLTSSWLRDVLVNGKRQRSYLNLSMPQFGQANVGHLVELFGKVDALEAAPIATVSNREASKKAGHTMIGSNGFSCIACHDFNGQSSASVGALDIVHVTERVQKNWFHLFMRQPSRFHPTVIMPSYWPGGQSIRPEILNGDTAQQIEALWTYLEDGIQVKKPTGLSRQSNEIRVGVVAEICRGRGPVGYRGLGVGYPQRINLAFDTEEMALRQLWKNEFANIDLGSFRPIGSDRISFPPGIPFHRLKSLDDNWPYKSKTNYMFPHDHGYQYRGYELDALRRPTFTYHYGDITVTDFFEDVRDKDDKTYFKRTFTFEATKDQLPFYFRAAVGEKITTLSNRHFTVDKLHLRITSDHTGIVREGNPGDVLIQLTLPQGRSTLTLEYQW